MLLQKRQKEFCSAMDAANDRSRSPAQDSRNLSSAEAYKLQRCVIEAKLRPLTIHVLFEKLRTPQNSDENLSSTFHYTLHCEERICQNTF